MDNEMNAVFDAILGEAAEEFTQAEVYSNWMPPDGDYTVLLTEAKNGVKVDENNRFAWVRLTGRILDDHNPELNEKEFSVGYFTTKVPGIMKGAVSILAGKVITNLKEAITILTRSNGTVVVVNVFTKPSKKNNQEYTNCNIQRVVSTVDAVPQEEPATA